MLTARTTSAFFYLLQAGLWEEENTLSPVFPLNLQEWEFLYRQSMEQTVEGIIYDGLQRLPIHQQPPRDLLLKWLVRIEHIERRNTWMNMIIGQQVQFFANHQIDIVLLKGQGLAQYYPKPLHRICGDIDWYFPMEKMYDKANQLILDQGLNLSYTAGYSSNYIWNTCDVEHHQRLFDLHNPFCKNFLKKLEKKEQKNKTSKQINGVSLPIPAPLINVLQVNSHILKHLLSFGIGMRQLCDAAILYYALKKEINGMALQRIYRKLGIEKWVDQLHHVLVHYIGLPQEDLPYALSQQSADWMMEDILLSGNFGFHDERYRQAEEQNKGNRVQVKKRLWNRFTTYFPYAPIEAISFPIVQFLSRFSR
ncbi:nucleotidyltransferase family protein [Sphingobacterium sp. SRCM116780]|uniref:nucleotidyltransferase domain-containing protein n=1 Tax=Sphingobacterium sp. SRCM116780 TaxID=2907623 RepID=UPI001F1E8188|nr:nucleotidyltransferase family protein [Sphingobacterium sp. SRCM116780]UIR55995.1 nucleotidyltransferase family protein [Sphingobacterium sp. SRCM116780]